jgi:hypothetical protein
MASQHHRRLYSLEEVRTAYLASLSKARQIVQIYAPTLDPRLLNNTQAFTTLQQFVRLNRVSQVQMLIINERQVSQLDHRLIRLCQTYPSYAAIRLIPKDFHEEPFAFMLVDGQELLYRARYDRFETEIHHLPSFAIKEKQKYFDEIWQQAAPASGLRALMI